jgi:hypothetical protein
MPIPQWLRSKPKPNLALVAATEGALAKAKAPALPPLEAARAALADAQERNRAAQADGEAAKARVQSARDRLREERSEAASEALETAIRDGARVQEWLAIVAQDLVEAKAAVEVEERSIAQAELSEIEADLLNRETENRLVENAARAWQAVLEADNARQAHIEARNDKQRRAFSLRQKLDSVRAGQSLHLDDLNPSAYPVAKRLQELEAGKPGNTLAGERLRAALAFLAPNLNRYVGM